jgi:hypothetical protein
MQDSGVQRRENADVCFIIGRALTLKRDLYPGA